MSTIGKNRLAIYDLFYRYPPCDYICNKKLNVLIIGNGWVGNEAFKAVFWDGQYPDVELNITIASNNAKQYEAALKEKLPGIGDFADFNGNRTSKYHYANIDIRDVSFDEIKDTGITDAMAARDCMNLREQNIIIVSVGDPEINTLLGMTISELLEKANKRVLVAVYDSDKISAFSDIDYVPFSADIDIDTSELMKLASNIKYVYDANDNFTVNRNKSHNGYLKAFNEEFEKTPEDTDDLFLSISDFTGMDYTADSSLAQAVHMPMKLDYCCHDGTIAEKTAELVKIINEYGKKFNLLSALEHRRWCAYMAIRACRMPRKNELAYLYSNDNTQKDKANNLHICMCECGQSGAKLDRHSHWWGERIPDDIEKFKLKFKELSDLDWASLYCHQILSDKTKNSNYNYIIDMIGNCNLTDEETADAFKNYESALKKLIARQEDVNSLSFYNLSLNMLRRAPQYEQIKGIIEGIDIKLGLAKERHKRIDFLSYDVQFISMIPLCLKLIKNDSTIITFTNGQAANDIIVPWVLCADKAVFVEIRPDSSSADKKNAIQNFFNLHGNNTELEFDDIKDLKIESIKSKIETLLEKHGNVVFNITPNIPSTILLALGEFAGKIQIVSYDSYRGLSYFNFNDLLPHRTENMKLDVGDYLSLMQGKINDSHGTLMPYKKCQNVEDLFWDSSIVRIIFQGDSSKPKYYTEWNSVIIQNFLQRKPNESKIVSDKKASTKLLPLTSTLNYISDEKFCGIAKSFLGTLKSNNIISNYTEVDDRRNISFRVIDNDFYRFISDKGGNLFEILVYYKLLYTCIFDDVRTGVGFQWKSGGSELISNEIDVIATKGVDLVLVSCKTSPMIDNSYIYEIASEAASFGGLAVLAVSQDLSSPNNYNHNAVVRAQAMNVALIDQHIIKNEKLLKKAMNQIIAGKYKGPENF